MGSGLASVQPVDTRSTVLGAASTTELGQGDRWRSFLLLSTTEALQDLVLHVDDAVQ
jgi:hypothetical protein